MSEQAASEHQFRRRRWAVAAVALAILAPILAACEPPVPATSAVYDAFERPDSAGLGTAQTGQVWTTHSGSPALVGGDAVLGAGAATATVQSARSNGAAATTMAALGNEFWLVLRLSDDQNYWRFGRANGGAYVLQQIQGNQIGPATIESLATITPQALDRLSCRLNDDTITCSVDGILVARTTNGFNVGATRHGISTWQSPEARFEEFRVGELVVMPDIAVSMAVPGQVQVGAPIAATGTITNIGLAPMSAATANWSLPAGVTGFTGTSPAGPCTTSGQTLICPVGNLGVDQSRTVTMTVTAPSTAGPVALLLAGTHGAADELAVNNADWGTVTVTTGPPPTPDDEVLDDFGRPDSVGLGVAPTGQAWTTHSGTPSVAGARAVMGGASALATVPTIHSNALVSATVSQVDTELWLVLRLSDGQNYWRFGRTGGGSYVLRQVRNGAPGNPLLEVRADVVPAVGDRLSCRLTSSTIGCSVDGVLVVSSGDDFNRSATRHGLAAWNSPSAAFDDFSVAELPVQPDLITTVTAPAEVQSGGSVQATAMVTNTGIAMAPGAALEWAIPNGLTEVSGSSSNGSCSLTGAVLRCTLGDLAVGASATAALSGVAPVSPGQLSLLANAGHAGIEAEPSDNADVAFVSVINTPPLSVVFDPFDRPNGFGLGSAVTGQPWATHFGTPALMNEQATLGGQYGLVSVESARSNGVVATAIPATGSEFWMVMRKSDDANYWRFGRLNDGAYVIQKIQGNQVGSSQLELLASITPEAGDRLSCRLTSTTIACSVDGVLVVRTGDDFNRTATRHGLAAWQSAQARFDDFTVAELPVQPDLFVAFSGTRAIEVGGPVELTSTVVNAGSSAASAAVLDGTAPAAATDLEVSAPDGTCTVAGATFHCELGDMAAGSSESVSIEWTAPGTAGPVTTYVQASHNGTDADPGNNQASLTTTVRVPTPLGAAVSDDFNRPTGSDLGATDTGETWTIRHGGFQIVDGRAAPTSSYSFASVDTGFSFGTYDLTLAAGASSRFYIALRVVDANNYYRLTTNPSTGTYRLEKVVNGAVQQMYANFERAAVQAHDGDAIRIVLQADDSIYVFVNGEHIIDSGDVQFMDATGFGFITDSMAPRFDDLFISSVAQGLPVSDTFTRPDDPTSLGTPEQGIRVPWRVWVGGFWGVDAGVAAHGLSAGYGMVAVNASSEAAGVQARFTALGAEQWVVFRHVESGSYFRFGGTGGGQYAVQFVNGSSATVPASLEMVNPTTVATGDLVQVVQFLDGRIEGYVNGVLVLRFVDTMTNRRATSYGMAMLGDQARFDDFAVTLPQL